MRNATMSSTILHHLIKYIPGSDCFMASLSQPFMNRKSSLEKCEGFLCGKECNNIVEWVQDEVGNYESFCEKPNWYISRNKT